jgi:hypothetical protein
MCNRNTIDLPSGIDACKLTDLCGPRLAWDGTTGTDCRMRNCGVITFVSATILQAQGTKNHFCRLEKTSFHRFWTRLFILISLIDELYLQPARCSGIISVPNRPYRVSTYRTPLFFLSVLWYVTWLYVPVQSPNVGCPVFLRNLLTWLYMHARANEMGMHSCS